MRDKLYNMNEFILILTSAREKYKFIGLGIKMENCLLLGNEHISS